MSLNILRIIVLFDRLSITILLLKLSLNLRGGYSSILILISLFDVLKLQSVTVILISYLWPR